MGETRIRIAVLVCKTSDPRGHWGFKSLLTHQIFMKQENLPGNTPVCAYCGLEVIKERTTTNRWYHKDWTMWRPGQPKESRKHAEGCEKHKYPYLHPITEDDWKMTQVEKALDGLL